MIIRPQFGTRAAKSDTRKNHVHLFVKNQKKSNKILEKNHKDSVKNRQQNQKIIKKLCMDFLSHLPFG